MKPAINNSRRDAWGGDHDGQCARVVVCGPASAVGAKAAADRGRRKFRSRFHICKGAAYNRGKCFSQGKRNGRVVCRAAIVRGAAVGAHRLQSRHTRGGAAHIRRPFAARSASARPALGPMQGVREVRRDLTHQAAAWVAASRLCDTTASTMPGRWLTPSSLMASLIESLR